MNRKLLTAVPLTLALAAVFLASSASLAFAANAIDSLTGERVFVSTAEIDTFPALIFAVNRALNLLIPFIIGLGVFIIIWGIFGYISHAGEEEQRDEARAFIVWGVLGIFFMLSIWGFINILSNTFNLSKTVPPVPQMLPELSPDSLTEP